MIKEALETFCAPTEARCTGKSENLNIHTVRSDQNIKVSSEWFQMGHYKTMGDAATNMPTFKATKENNRTTLPGKFTHIEIHPTVVLFFVITFVYKSLCKLTSP